MSLPGWPRCGKPPTNQNEHALQLQNHATVLKQHMLRDKSKQPAMPHPVALELLDSIILLGEKIIGQPSPAEILTLLQKVDRDQTTTANNVLTIKDTMNTMSERARSPASSSATSGFKHTRNWAAVAAEAPPPPSQASFPSSFAATNASPLTTSATPHTDLTTKTERTVIVKLADRDQALKLRQRKTVLLQRVQNTLAKSGNPEINKITLLAAAQLKSGDVAVTTATTWDTLALQKHGKDWQKVFGTSAKVVVPTYGVIMNGVHVKSLPLHTTEAVERAKKLLIAANATNVPNMEITYMGWLAKPAEEKSESSVVIELTNPEHANLAIQKSLVWDDKVLGCVRYDRASRRKQCFRCHKYGHIGHQCLAPHELCGKCAGMHNSKECPTPDKKKCAACGGNHTAKDKACPERKKEDRRMAIARANGPRFWPVIQKPTTAAEPVAIPSPTPSEAAASRPESPQRGRSGAPLSAASSEDLTSNLSAPPTQKTGSRKPRPAAPASTSTPSAGTGLTSAFDPKVTSRPTIQATKPKGGRRSATSNANSTPIGTRNPQPPVTAALVVVPSQPLPSVFRGIVFPPAKNAAALRKRNQSRSPDKEGRNVETFSSSNPRTYLSSARTILADISNTAANKRIKTKAPSDTTSKKSLTAIREEAEIAATEENNSNGENESLEDSEDELSSQATDPKPQGKALKDDLSSQSTMTSSE